MAQPTSPPGGGSQGHGPDHGPYKFSVDGKPFESPEPVLTGAQIKARAQVDPSYALYIEVRGPGSNRLITDQTSVDLRDEPGRELFFTVPPANFGACA